jgi:hypothetical protein
MTEIEVPTRREAVRVLERQRSETLALVDRLPRKAVTTPGLGGGEWSPKDLIGHLASWEEYALDALAAWERGDRAPIDALTWSVSTARINRQNVERKAAWSLPKVRREAERTFGELVAAIEAMRDARWRGPATPRGRRPLALRVGGILGGRGPFLHDESHLPSLRAFVERQSQGAASRPLAPRRRSSRPAT